MNFSLYVKVVGFYSDSHIYKWTITQENSESNITNCKFKLKLITSEKATCSITKST